MFGAEGVAWDFEFGADFRLLGHLGRGLDGQCGSGSWVFVGKLSPAASTTFAGRRCFSPQADMASSVNSSDISHFLCWL